MGKTPHLNITVSSIEGLPDCPEAGQLQIRYGKKATTSAVKSPLRTGHSSDIMETFTFPVDGPAVQFDVFHVKGAEVPIICSGGFVITSTKPGYAYDGPIKLLDKTNGLCDEPKLFVNMTIV